MNLDRRIYLVTGLAALVAGSAVVIASPQDPLAAVSIVHDATGSAAGGGALAWRNGAAHTGVVIHDAGGVGLRAPAAALAMDRR